MSPSSGSTLLVEHGGHQKVFPRFRRRRTGNDDHHRSRNATLITLTLFLTAICLIQHSLGLSLKASFNSDPDHRLDVDSSARLRRQTPNSRSESLLTVEWEGIQSGDHPDSAIRGFIVEYRAEKESQWNVHSGIIPYKGPNHQYRVQIPKLPTGISYFVRIKVLGDKNEVLVETPEIRARNEIVSIKCDAEEVTAPSDVEVKERGQFSVALAWQPPECGSIGEYQIELRGRYGGQQFDAHRQTVAQPSASITGLLPGTEYAVRIRAVDRSRTVGPWNEDLVTVSTKGEALETSGDGISIEYVSNTEARIHWKPLTEERLQHYEVILVELGKNDLPERIERTRVSPTQNSFFFNELKPNTEYTTGVVAYVDHEPRLIYRLIVPTGDREIATIDQKPVIVSEVRDHFQVHWKYDDKFPTVRRFIVEYRPGNDTKWLRVRQDAEVGAVPVASYAVNAPELVDAFSVRVVLVDDEGQALARTKEAVVVRNEGVGCDSVPITSVQANSNPSSIVFTWKRPQCDESIAQIVGYEYSFWKRDELVASETTAFSEHSSITTDNLSADSAFLFRVRSRLVNGHGPWSSIVEAFTAALDEKPGINENIYRLRIVLSPPKSYFVWTPSPEHLNNIVKFKVSYKLTTSDSWTNVIRSPTAFQCPAKIANPGDFCFDLNEFEHGKQYTANLVYELNEGRWTQHGTPLFFILVEGDEEAHISGVGGEFDAIASTTPAEEMEEGTSELGHLSVEDRGPATVVHWEVGIDQSNIRAYQVDQRTSKDSEWRPVSNYIAVDPHQQKYQVEVSNAVLALAGEDVRLRVKAIGPDGKAFTVSKPITLKNACKKIENPPTGISLVRVSPDSVLLRWSYPRDQAECGLYFVVTGTVDSASIQLTVNGNQREHHFDQNRATNWQLRIHAVNKVNGGPHSQPINLQTAASADQTVPSESETEINKHRLKKRSICDPRTDFWCRDDDFDIDNLDGSQLRGEALVSQPTISQTSEGTIKVQWKSQGNGRGVFGYKVLFRTESSGWNPYGQIVPYIGDNEEYSIILSGLLVGQSYRVQVQALDRNSYVLYTSPEVSAQSSCQPPSHPPSHIAADSPDSRHVRVTWKIPPQSSWFCSQIQVELKVDEPPGIASVRVDSRQTSHVFDAVPDQRWTIRARTVNSAGQSAWTTSASTRSPPSGELIEGPFVSNLQGVPRLSWRSREGSDPDLINHFLVEWRAPSEQRWNTLRERVPYSGWQRPYSLDLTSLPRGHVQEVRVTAIDHNFDTAFVSPSVTIQSSPQCSPPKTPPRNIQVTTIGPTQIRLSWQPLAEPEWNCDNVWYVVKYSSPESQGYKNLTRGETQVVFDSKPFTQWQFEVQAANQAGASHWSIAKRSSTFSSAPGPIEDFTSQSLSPDSVQLSWRPPSDPNGVVTGYEITYQLISRGMCDGAPERGSTVFSDRPGFVLSQLYPHSKYRVAIAAKTAAAGERIVREIQTDQAAPTGPPAHFRVENIGESGAELSWQAPPCINTNGDITEYEYEIVGAGRFATSIPRTTDVTRSVRVQLQGLIGGSKYQARVRAFTARGAGPWTQAVPFQTRGQPSVGVSPAQQQLTDPNPRVFQTGSNEAYLVWQTGQQNAAYYDKFRCQWVQPGRQDYQQKVFPAHSPCELATIHRHRLPESTEQLQTHCGPIRDLRPNVQYQFQTAHKPREGQWSSWSRPSPPIPAPSLETPVRITSITKLGGTSTSLHFTWTVPPTDLLRCTAFRITVVPRDGREPARVFTVDGNTFQYQVDGLRPATIYAVTVEPIVNDQRHAGLTVDMSTDADRVFGLNQRPRIVEERATSITIEWDVPPSIQCSNFMIEYRLEDGVWQQFDRRVPCQTGRGTYTGTVTGLPTNSVVDLRVRVISLQNQPSTPSPEVRGHTKCSPPESPPQALRVDAPTNNEVRVSWARPAKNTWNCDELNVDIGYRVGDQPERIITVTGDKTTHIFPSEPNTRWIVRVRSSNPVGYSPWSPEQTLTTRQGAPGAVRGLRLTPLSPNEIRVQWMPPQVSAGTIVGYDISYRLKHRLACPEEEPRDVSRDFVTVYNHKDLDYTLTGLLPNSLYEVKVRARTTELGPEETGEAATLQQPPSAPPLNLQLTYALERSLSFQWEPVECSQRHGEIINYEYEIIGQDDWAKLERQIANTTDTRVTIEGLTPYTKYVFRVKAYNSVGGGPNTENLDVMTAKANAPLPPQDLVVTQEGTHFIAVSWLPPYPPYGPHDSYKLQYQLIHAQSWETIEIGVNDRRLACPVPGPRLCFNITGLQSGQQYRIRVAAHIEGGNYGPYSNTIIANTLQILPEAPRGIELIAKTDHSLHIKWIPPIDVHGLITQYRLRYQSLAEPDARKETVYVKHPQMTYLIDGLKPETTYNISLSAGTTRGFGPEIWARFTTDPFKTPRVLEAPIVIPEGPHTLHVEWKGVVDTQNRIDGYIVEFRMSDTSVWTESAAPPAGIIKHYPGRLSYNTKLTNLEPDTLYFVRIKVVDTRQKISEPSPEAQGRTGCAPPTSPPTNPELRQMSHWSQVKMSWQPPAKSSWLCASIRYRIECTNGSNPVRPVDVPSGYTEHTFESGPSSEWVCRIQAVNDAGASDWSAPVRLKTTGGKPGKITDLKVDPTSDKTAVATWSPPPSEDEITGYDLTYTLRSIGDCGPSSGVKPITKHSREGRIDLDGLLPDSTYDVTVVAHTTVSGDKSDVVSFRTEEAPPTGQPKNLRVTGITSTRAELNWNEIECELRHGKILDYKYELEVLSEWGDRNTSESTSTHRVSLDNLKPFTQYRVHVQGRNSKGSGPFTDWVYFETLPAAPPPPTDLRVEQELAHALEISFLPPYPPNGIIDLYRIRHTPHKKFNYKESQVPAFQLECSDAAGRQQGRLCYRITKLEPEQEYEIQAAAHTQRGDWSEWSEPLIARTIEQTIPVLERPLELDFVRSTSIGVKWQGLDEAQAEHIVGYVLEYKSEDDVDWQEWNGIVRHRPRQNEYKATVRNLKESTEYFFRLRVVGKGDKRGGPGPELKAITKCGPPEQPPQNVKLESVDFQSVRVSWENPPEETWRCDQVEFVLHYSNVSGHHKTIRIASDAPHELIFDSVPGTRWEAKMRTQTIELGEEPKHSKWSNRATLFTRPQPNEIFLKVTPKTPTTAVLDWHLPDGYEDWPYGVDISYRLVRMGSCTKLEPKDQEPVVLENVQDKQVLLENLYPGSEYEVTITLRRPPGLEHLPAKSTTTRFKTDDLAPVGAPQRLKVDLRQDTKLGFSWEPPECIEQNGEISQYEYDLTGLDDWNRGTREGVSPRTRAEIGELMPGSLYRFRVRAFTSAGPGPWSEPIDARTTGSEIGPPRDLTAIGSKATSIQITWLPPHPEISPIAAYRVRYSTRADESHPQEIELSGDELSCGGFISSIITREHLCTTLTGLKPLTTYKIAVQGKSISGNWGPWSHDIFYDTRPEMEKGGYLQLVSAGHDNLKVRWNPPPAIAEDLDKYEVFISPVVHAVDQQPQQDETPPLQRDYHFKKLTPLTRYNVSVQGISQDTRLWFISNVFSTTDFADLHWLPALCELELIERTDTSLHINWVPPDVFEPNYRDSITHYRVTITPLDSFSLRQGQSKNYTVMFPGNSIRFDHLMPQAIYNVSVKAGTDTGYGQPVWGVWSTLPSGVPSVLRLKSWTPTTLTVEWDPIWGTSHKGYTLVVKTMTSIYPNARTGAIKSFELSSSTTEYTIRGLEPATTYNLTLMTGYDGAWGIFSTLTAGCFLPRDLKHCDQTQHATAMSWEPVEFNMATHYQVRYIQLHSGKAWNVEEERHRKYLLCPKDPCGRLCYLVFNLELPPEEYAFQVRAKVDGYWNNWKLAGRPTIADSPEVKESCCIVPPPYHVYNIGADGTMWQIPVGPSPTEQNITRYYVVVDEREPPGDTNWTQLTDKVTANRLKIPYYVAGSFSTETLTEPTTFPIGDGTVVGGYLNYPLTKGKTYNYEIYTKWMMHGNQPVISRLRAAPFLTAGWPWWWLLLLLLLLLLCILLCCFLLWLIRKRKEGNLNGQHVPLLREEFETKGRSDFEDGYTRGFRDAQRGGMGGRRRFEEEYSSRTDRFQEGYAKGLRDAGASMSQSMSNLALRPSNRAGYSAGYMQGFRDGNSGVFGDRISESLLRRLEEQYPSNDDFKAGYIDGFKDGVNGGRGFEESRRIQQSLTELTERLTTIEKTKGDEIHSTKIYHVYNQTPEGGGYVVSSTGQQLVNELEDLASGSRRSTLRRHYTPGDYLRYEGSEFDSGFDTLGRARRSMSASALARDSSGLALLGTEQRQRRLSGASFQSREIGAGQAGIDSESYHRSTRYHRSRSELGSPPHRYASQTLLDAPRPGPSAPHARRDALHSLQRELDSLSRSPRTAEAAGTGYAASTTGAYAYDTYRSGASEVAEQQQQQQKEEKSSQLFAKEKSFGESSVSHQQQQEQKDSGGQTAVASGSHNWADNLIDIVHEPMGQTLDRMRQYSSSMSNVDRGGEATDREQYEQKYHRTYKEEVSNTGR